MKVHRVLGCGFLEKIYANALAIELKCRDVRFERQARLEVGYRGEPVGLYIADFIVETVLLLEIKATRCLLPEHESQLLNYLHASKIETGLLLNFGASSLQQKRMTIAPPTPGTAQSV